MDMHLLSSKVIDSLIKYISEDKNLLGQHLVAKLKEAKLEAYPKQPKPLGEILKDGE